MSAPTSYDNSQAATPVPQAAGEAVAMTGPVAKDAAEMVLAAIGHSYGQGKIDSFKTFAQEVQKLSSGELLDRADKLQKTIEFTIDSKRMLKFGLACLPLGWGILMAYPALVAVAGAAATTGFGAGICLGVAGGACYLSRRVIMRSLHRVPDDERHKPLLSNSEVKAKQVEQRIIKAELASRLKAAPSP